MPYKDPEAQRRYNREWVARRRAAWFKDQRCFLCGSRESLELHHVDPALKISHNVWSWSQARRDAELIKCVVLCKVCHDEVSAEQMKKETCERGHVYAVTGRDSNRTCSECRREHHRRYRREGTKK